MNENLNLLEILKDCHKGTKFYSRFLGSVEFCNITSDNYIEVMDKNECHIEFKPNGTYKHSEENAEIDLFPSKDQRDWSKWHSPFVKGDILVSEKGNIVLCSHIDEEQVVHFHCILNFWGNFEIYNGTGVGYSYNCNLANDSQKQRLFDALKKEGYEWDDTTKTLEKLITPKFKDEDKNHLWTIQDAKEGDVLAINWYEGYDYWEKIVIFKKYHNEGANSPCVEGYGNTFKNRKLAFHEEVPRFSKTWTSCLEPATKEQRDLLFQTIKEAGYKWNADEKKLEKLIEPKFKDGDIVATNDGKYIAIIKNNGGKYYVCCHPNVNYFNIDRSGWFDRLATLEEKEKLFAYIKENGYKWNAKTKTLEKLIVPKFKVGDKIKHKDIVLTIITVQTNSYIIEDKPDNFGILMFSQQDKWELINEPKFKVGDTIKKKNGLQTYKITGITSEYYSTGLGHSCPSLLPVKYQDEYILISSRFDPTTLQHFDKVLVTDSFSIPWTTGFFSYIKESGDYRFVVGASQWRYCIPYNNDTKHLVGKCDEDDKAPEFYRHWEE